MNSLKNIDQTFYLGTYHFLFIGITYVFFLQQGGDANLYWFKDIYTSDKSWLYFFNVGTDFILFLNYPFAKILQLPIGFGFLLYGAIGFLGVLQFQRLTYLIVGSKNVFIKGINTLPLLFYLPNMHFWTANIGKEALCFLWLSTIFLELAKNKYTSLLMWFSAVCLFMLRPHVFLMLLVPIVIGVFFKKNIKAKYKIITGFIGLMLSLCAYYFFLILSEIKSLNWERLQRFNLGSILSFKDSGSYVPIHEYSYIEKFFAFFFRPLFWDAHNLYQFVLSVENAVILIAHIGIIILIFWKYKKIKFDWIDKVIVGFVLFSFLLYVQRYAGLGIFVRTKVMLQPFLLIVFFKILTQSLSKLKNAQT